MRPTVAMDSWHHLVLRVSSVMWINTFPLSFKPVLVLFLKFDT